MMKPPLVPSEHAHKGAATSSGSSGRTDGAGDGSSFRDAIEQAGMMAAAGRQTPPGAADEDTARARILDQGFQAYAEHIRQENLERLREKILKSMGLSEEDLARMPLEQRETIEDIIAKELERRMMALAELNGGQETRTAMMTRMRRTVSVTHVTATVTHANMPFATDGRAAAMGSSSSGLGPLLALQEIELAKAEPGEEPVPAPGKNDRERRDMGS